MYSMHSITVLTPENKIYICYEWQLPAGDGRGLLVVFLTRESAALVQAQGPSLFIIKSCDSLLVTYYIKMRFSRYLASYRSVTSNTTSLYLNHFCLSSLVFTNSLGWPSRINVLFSFLLGGINYIVEAKQLQLCPFGTERSKCSSELGRNEKE